MKEVMSNKEFKLMHSVMKLIDKVHPHVKLLSGSFGIQNGMTIVDYGCGPGRYTEQFAHLVGAEGKVYAVDVLQIALDETKKRLELSGTNNVELKLASGYNSEIDSGVADIVFVIDMFHHVGDKEKFLRELYRIVADDGMFIVSGGHQTRTSIKRAIAQSGLWHLDSETKSYIAYLKNQ